MFQTNPRASGSSRVMRWSLKSLMEKIQVASTKKSKTRTKKGHNTTNVAGTLSPGSVKAPWFPSYGQYYCMDATVRRTQRYCYGHRLHNTVHVHSNGLNVPNSMRVDWFLSKHMLILKGLCVDLQVERVPTSGHQTAAQQAAVAALHSWQPENFPPLCKNEKAVAFFFLPLTLSFFPFFSLA